MALVLADRIKETTTTTGTGTYTLAGAVAGFEPFTTIGNGNTTYYACTLGSDFEVGIGTYTASGTTLARTTILQSSNNDNAVDWGAGEKTIFCTQPAEKAVFLNASDNIELADNKKIILGTGSDLAIFHDGSNSAIIDQGTGGLFIRGTAINIDDSSSNDYITATEGGAVTLFHNGSARLITTSTGAKVTGGTGDGTLIIESDTDNSGESDNALLQLTQDGGLSVGEFGFDSSNALFIKNTLTGAVGNVQFMNGTEILAKGIGGGAFELYHDNSKKLETTSSGVEVTGTVTDDGATHDGDMTLIGGSGSNAVWSKSSAVLNFLDNAKLSFGTGNDLRIWHSGTNSFLRDEGTGVLFVDTNGTGIHFRKDSSETMAKMLTDGAVELYHDNSKKLETTSSGATVTGELAATSLDISGDVDVDGTLEADAITLGGTAVPSISSTSTLTNKTLTTPVINGFSGTGNGSITGDLTLTATDDSSNSTPELKLVRHSASPADFDYIGGLSFFADNSADQNIEFGTLEARIRDVTDGTEDFAGFELFGIKNGTARQRFMILGQEIFHLMNQQSIRFDDITSTHDLIFSPPSSLSTSQTITLPDATGTVLLNTGDQSITGDLTLTSTDAGASADPTLDLYRNSSSPADQDIIGQINFSGENDASEKITYGEIRTRIRDVTDGTENGAIETFVETNGSLDLYTVHQDGESQFYKDVQIISNDSGSTENPTLQLYRNSSSPAVNDVIGHITFSGENDAGEKIKYAEIETFIADETDGTEDGSLQIRHIRNGVDTLTYASGFGGNFFYKTVFLHTGVNISFEGATSNANETVLTVTDPTADRTITLPDASGTVQLTDGSGASLTSLNASQLSSGTVPNARLDAQLQDVAGLAVTNGNFIVGDGSNFVAESGSTARTSLGLGTAAVLDTGISNTNVPKFTSGVADNDFLRVDGTSIEGRSASEVLSDIGGISASSTDTLTNKTLTTPVINGFSGTGDGSITGDLTLTSTDAGASENPTLDLYRNSSSPADNDILGHIHFSGENDADQKVVYNEIESRLIDASDGNEHGRLVINSILNGSTVTYYSSGFGFNQFHREVLLASGINLRFEGSTNDGVRTTLTVADPSSNRTITLPDATGTVSLLTNTETLTNKTLTNPTINAFSGTGDGSITGDLTLTSTDAGSGEDPNLKLFRNSSSPANSDNIGTVQFQGKNNADETTTFAEIQSQISDVTDGAEDGVLYFQVRRNGSLTSIANVSGSSGRFNISNGDLFLQTGAELIFEGATSDAHETTLTVTDPTADRTITLPDATGTVLTTGNSDTPTTTTSSSDADFVLIDDGGTMKKITPSNLGITSGGTTAAFATAMAMVL